MELVQGQPVLHETVFKQINKTPASVDMEIEDMEIKSPLKLSTFALLCWLVCLLAYFCYCSSKQGLARLALNSLYTYSRITMSI